MATDVEVYKALALLQDYYEKKVDERQLPAYVHGLRDIPDDVLTMAVYDCMAELKWLPKISELREAAKKIKDNSRRSTQYDDDPGGMLSARQLFWLAMEAFNRDDWSSKEWQWYERKRPAPVVDNV